LIDFKKVRHAARPSKDLRTPSLFGSSNGPTKHRTTGPRNDLTGILVCRRSTGFTDTFGCHRHLRMSTGNHHTPEPPGARRSANCAWRTPVLHTVQRIPPPSLFGSSPSVSRTLTSASGHSPEPPGSIEHLRVFTERLRAFTGAPSLHGRDFRDPPHDPQQHGQPRLSTGRLRSTNRCVMLATSVLGCSPEPPGSNRVPSGDSPKPVRPHSPFNGDSIVSLQRTTRSKAPGRTVQRLWRHGGHFRVDPRLSSLSRR